MDYIVGSSCSLRYLFIMFEIDGVVDAHELLDVDGVVSRGDYAVPVQRASCEVVHYLYPFVAELDGETFRGDAVDGYEGGWCCCDDCHFTEDVSHEHEVRGVLQGSISELNGNRSGVGVLLES